jgi:hypothetical protein
MLSDLSDLFSYANIFYYTQHILYAMLCYTLLFQVFSAIPEAGISLADLQISVGADNAKIGMGPCMKSKWVKKNGELLVRAIDASTVHDTTRDQLVAIQNGLDVHLSDDDYKNLKRRKLVLQVCMVACKQIYTFIY